MFCRFRLHFDAFSSINCNRLYYWIIEIPSSFVYYVGSFLLFIKEYRIWLTLWVCFHLFLFWASSTPSQVSTLTRPSIWNQINLQFPLSYLLTLSLRKKVWKLSIRLKQLLPLPLITDWHRLEQTIITWAGHKKFQWGTATSKATSKPIAIQYTESLYSTKILRELMITTITPIENLIKI